MKQFPSIPRVENAPPDLFESGHLWIQEKMDGANFRFRLRESGMLQFGDRSRTYDADGIPEPYQHAVRHVRERLDRDALRNSVDDVESVVFFGEAMHQHAIDYDWGRVPSFLGFDVWDASDADAGEGHFLPPDAVEQVYDRLGLRSVNAIQKEVRATDFDPESYEVPQSDWYDGPAEGVVVRNKRGQRAKLLHPDFREVDDTVPVEIPDEEVEDAEAIAEDAEETTRDAETIAELLARKYATRRRVEKIVHKLEDRNRPVTFDAVYERVVEDVVREEHKQLFHGERSIDVGTFRSEIAARTRQFLEN